MIHTGRKPVVVIKHSKLYDIIHIRGYIRHLYEEIIILCFPALFDRLSLDKSTDVKFMYFETDAKTPLKTHQIIPDYSLPKIHQHISKT